MIREKQSVEIPSKNVVPITRYSFLFYEQDSHVLLLRRALGRSGEGMVASIGGHYNPGEGRVDGARREWSEETQTDALILDHRGVVYWSNLEQGQPSNVGEVYSIRRIQGNIKVDNNEGEAVWVPVNGFEEHPHLTELNKQLLRKLYVTRHSPFTITLCARCTSW